MIYAWQEKAWQQIASCGNNIPNAWLLSGRRGIGKTAFARHLSSVLLCENPPKPFEACGVCPSCRLSEQGSHPDFYELTPKKDEEDNAKKLLQIKIEEVREVIKNIHLTPLRGHRRVVLIHPAEAMNVQAANALLKVLEEPSDTVVFILVSNSKDRLLPTIKSRCRHFALPQPNKTEAVAFLQEKKVPNAFEMLAFHGGSPLFEFDAELDDLRQQLLAVLSVPRMIAILDFAALFDRKKQPLSLFLEWFNKWLIDLIAVLHGDDEEVVFYPQHAKKLSELAEKLNLSDIFGLYDQTIRLVPYGQHTLNVKLTVECLLIDYFKMYIRN
ncbi:MAG: DNA polymerase III subunit delta' [Neisseriaceae bacterium]|nr:DNA polymerase III subunit delta' [Neisseriaceae bacterium]MBR5675551.1 DNA polymerase III subunit delta' [Neisseriaceae bacterium]MBR5941600.1 DNA polymerase III subunit delta' [Neisseriaceae bacterium]